MNRNKVFYEIGKLEIHSRLANGSREFPNNSNNKNFTHFAHSFQQIIYFIYLQKLSQLTVTPFLLSDNVIDILSTLWTKF